MTTFAKIFLAGFLATAVAKKDSVRGLRQSTPTSNKVTLSNPCMIIARHTQYEDVDVDGNPVHTSKAQWDCDLQGSDIEASGNEIVEIIGLDGDFRAASGMSMLFAEGAELTNGQLNLGGLEVFLHQNEIVMAERSNQRRLGVRKSLGEKTVLVVRVSSNSLGSKTSATSATLSDKIFGTSGDQVNLHTWYKECSYGDLIFKPFVGRYNGNYITNGVLDVTVNLSDGRPEKEMRRAMVKAVQEKLNILNLYSTSIPGINHIMLVLPPNTAGSWVAYAWLDGQITVFNDGYGTSPSAQMHELGHNLGLNHANENGFMYEDRSGMMGYSYRNDEWPRQCFNPANSWHLGWYSGQRTDWNPLTNGSWSGTLLGVADYTRNNLNKARNVVVRLGDGITEGDIYIGFNRAKGMNIETIESKDMVVVVRDDGADEAFYMTNGKTAYTESTLLASLAYGKDHIIKNFKGSNRHLVIRYSGFSDGAHVDVYFLGQCKQNSDCSYHTCAPAGTCQAGSCVYDETKCSLLSLAVVTGSNPKATAYTVVNDCSGQEILSGGDFYEESTAFGTELPISDDGQYTIILHDPSGESQLLVNGQEVVAAGSEYPRYTIGACPTLPPTSAATAKPTIGPSQEPSIEPSMSPSSVPTQRPAESRSMPPSSAPSQQVTFDSFSRSMPPSSAPSQQVTFDSFSDSFDGGQASHFLLKGQGIRLKADDASKKYKVRTRVVNQLDKPSLEAAESMHVTEISHLTIEINFQVQHWRSDGGLAVHYRPTGSNDYILLKNTGPDANPLINLKGLAKKETSISYDFDVSNVEGEIFLRIMNDGSSRRDRLDFKSIQVSGSTS